MGSVPLTVVEACEANGDRCCGGHKKKSQRCGTCRFWDHTYTPETGIPAGLCRCNSPRPHRGERADITAWWPETECCEWCGDWEAVDVAGPPATRAAFLDEPVCVLGLSGRVLNSLDRWRYDDGRGIETVGELVELTARELLELRNFGRFCLTEVRQKLAAHGLKLRGDPPAVT